MVIEQTTKGRFIVQGDSEMTTAIMTVAAIIVLAILVGFTVAERLLARNCHAQLCGIESQCKGILTDGTASEHFQKIFDWECARADEQAELRVLAKGLVYEADLESPLSAPQIVPVAPLFAPLPANGNNGLFAANG